MKRVEFPFTVRKDRDGRGPDVLACIPLLERGVPHGFTYRWRLLDQGETGGSYGLPGRQRRDGDTLAHSIGLSEAEHMKQVHGTRIRLIAKPSPMPPVCDGILTSERDLGLIVQTADCIPLLLWESRSNVVGAVHAGWRGTLASIAARAVRKLEVELASRPADIHVVMGPAIGRCCYEVGEEVRNAFLSISPDASHLFSSGGQGRDHFDLVEANRRQLVEAGVPPGQIYRADICTSCDNDVLYSYRREGNGVGRQYGIIGVTRRKAGGQ